MLTTIDLRPEVAGPAAALEPTPVGPSRADRVERWVTLIAPFALFVWVGWRIAVDAANLPGDALSRMANASSAVLSRDPHLESIGFIWSPFPTLWQVPLVNLGRIWPVLVDRALIAVFVSAFLMTWTVSVLRRWLVDAGVQRVTRLVLVTAFVVHPFILLYGANGMSEAGMLCFSVLAARRLALWFETERPIELSRAGIALGFGYLTRYEFAATIVAVIALVAVMAYHRADGEHRDKLREGALRASVVGVPAVFAMVLWTIISWAIVDEPFAQFSSKYGNSQLVKAGAAGIIASAGSIDGLPRVVFFLKQLMVVGAIGAVATVLLVWWGTRGGPRIFSALVVLGAPIGFQLLTAYSGSSFAWGRYVISVVPLTIMLLGAASVSIVAAPGANRRMIPLLICSLAAVSSLIGLVLTRSGELETGDERAQLAAVPTPYGTGEPYAPNSAVTIGSRIAAGIDALHPRHGEVLTDTAAAFAIVINADDQRDYVIPADRDFERINADPGIFGIRYILVPDASSSAYNAVSAERPSLYEDGAGIATLVKEWPGGRQMPGFRLYELNADQRVKGN